MPIRLLGYANEVGEAFRAQAPLKAVHASYGIAAAYCLADTIDKAYKARKEGHFVDWIDRKVKIVTVAVDTLIWQSMASVVIPGFTINRVCAGSLYALNKYSTLVPQKQKWITTAIGLGCIPLIVKPIDQAVDLVMDNSLRLVYLPKRRTDEQD
ncbi:Mitochondrial fission process protein 1 [Halotydeus destructor]|nr:Mitochondrial fission process protein 1 [Halotydeus destructor]